MTNKQAAKCIVKIYIAAIVVIGIALLVGSAFSGFYTTEQHIERISERVQERFIDTGAHESFKLYPLYNQDDKLTHFLVEFPEDGYLYIDLSFKLIFGHDMYQCNNDTEYCRWYRYRYDIDSPAYDESIVWKYAGEGAKGGIEADNGGFIRKKAYVEVNENGKAITRTISHYAAAGVGEDEKRYLIKTTENNYIPAVKRDGKYLNLVSMELYDLGELIYLSVPEAMLHFIVKDFYDL